MEKKLCFYDDFKYSKKIIENRNFLRAKNVYLGVPGLTAKATMQAYNLIGNSRVYKRTKSFLSPFTTDAIFLSDLSETFF